MEWNFFNVWTWIAIAVLIAFAVLTWTTLKMTGGPSRGRRVAWLVLRGLILGALLIILLNPHRVERSEFREPLDVAILVDDSTSMTLRDNPDEPTRFEKLKARLPEIQKLVGKDARLRWYRFADETSAIEGPDQLSANGTESNIGKALKTVLGDEQTRQLGAVVLISDGQTRDADAARSSAKLFEQAKIPLFTHLIGTSDESPDLRLIQLTANQESTFSPRVEIQGLLNAPGFRDQIFDLKVTCRDQVVYQSQETIVNEKQPFKLVFKTPFTGFQRYHVEFSPLPGERRSDNNSGSVGAEIRDQKIRVLNMEGTPREGHYLENALEVDPDIEVTSLFFPQSSSIESSKQIPFTVDVNGRKIYNVAHPTKGYPRSLEEMLNYDVIINSDIYKDAFTPEQLDDTVSLVEEHGGGFVMVGGFTAFGSGHYDETVIDKLMPVDVYDNEGIKHGSFQLDIPDDVLGHPIMAIGVDRNDTAQIWREKFPGFAGLNTVNRVKPGATALALNPNLKNSYGPLIVFAVQQIGRGRTMAFTSDTTSSWGSRFQSSFGTPEDRNLYYRRFWTQTVRWLAADRIRRKSGELRIELDQNTAIPGETVNVSIPYPESNPEAAITLGMGLPDTEPEPVELTRNEVTRSWKARLKMPSEGEWILTARMPQKELDPLFTRALINVIPDQRELDSTSANQKLMSQLAAIGGAQALSNNPAAWDIQVDSRGSRIIEFGNHALWDRWWVIGLLLVLLTLEWGLRRRWIGGAA